MDNKEKTFISAVIYVHDDSERLVRFLRENIAQLCRRFEKLEIICVNDASKDDSVEIIKKIAEEFSEVMISIVNMSYYHGRELAMNAGVDLAIGDFVYEFDSVVIDYDTAEIWNIYDEALKGFDIVSASPDIKQKRTSSLFYYIFNKFTVPDYKLNTERFRILSRRVINRVNSMNRTIPYRKAVYANCGLKTCNVLYKANESNDREGSDRQEKGYRKKLAVDALLLFTEVGYRFSIAMTLLMMAIAIFMGIYAAVIYLCGTPIAGWTTTILFLSIAFFGLFGILTIIIKYLDILIDLEFKKQRYSFESIEKL